VLRNNKEIIRRHTTFTVANSKQLQLSAV